MSQHLRHDRWYICKHSPSIKQIQHVLLNYQCYAAKLPIESIALETVRSIAPECKNNSKICLDVEKIWSEIYASVEIIG